MHVNVPSMQLHAVIAVIYVATGTANALVSMLCCRVCRESLSLLQTVMSLQEEVLYKERELIMRQQLMLLPVPCVLAAETRSASLHNNVQYCGVPLVA